VINGIIDSPLLLAQARAGDGESFRLLCEPLSERLLRQALVLCRDETQARDLVQETWIEAWKSLKRYNGECQFTTWLCSILLHRHQSALRRAKWRAWLAMSSADHPESSLNHIADDSAGPDTVAELSDRSRVLTNALQRLPPRQREVVFLRFYADESIAGMAAALGCSAGTIKSRLFHALENLRRMNIFREELR
jgi:RNA polymerase sigma-70 factor (ECF subfamily)